MTAMLSYITYCTLIQLYAILQDIHSVYPNSQAYFIAYVSAKILILTLQRFFLSCEHGCPAARLDRLKSLTYNISEVLRLPQPLNI
jgi:hypothetical protein